MPWAPPWRGNRTQQMSPVYLQFVLQNAEPAEDGMIQFWLDERPPRVSSNVNKSRFLLQFDPAVYRPRKSWGRRKLCRYSAETTMNDPHFWL